MAINVTLGEVKTQEEKSFPKLMITKDEFTVVFMLDEDGNGNGIRSTRDTWQHDLKYNPDKFYKTRRWNMDLFIDYNEPITLQNA